MRLLLALALGVYIGTASLSAQTGRMSVTDRSGRTVVLYKASYALVIGASDYAEGSGWPDLPGVPEDVQAVSEAFVRQGFEVETLRDPDHVTLRPALESFINRHGLAPENRLLIYFAGHGHTLRQSYGEQMGYLVPTDAPHPDRDRAGFLARALSMLEVEVLATKIQAKHALFIFDSCFAGGIFTLERKGKVPASITARVAEPVRFFITAGRADETVRDVSVFRRQLVAALDGVADLYADGYVTGMELGEFLYNKVVNYTREKQHPQYGKIRHPGLDKGDFVFRLPAPEAPEVPPLPVPGETEFTLEDLKQRAEAIEVAQEEWSAWQGRMQTAFEEVEAVASRPLPREDKAQAWQRFLDAYAGDNPYSSNDEALRSRANEEMTRWKQPPVVAPRPPESQTVRGRKPGERLEQSIAGVTFAQRYIPAGDFRMGSPRNEPGREDDETPHQVTLTRSFWMLETEVTHKQWRRLMKTKPSYFGKCGAECPVETVSWYDAVAFANRLSEKAGVEQCYALQCSGKAGVKGFTCTKAGLTSLDCPGWRLPTEAEWEYAARAGTETAIYTGPLAIAGANNGPELDAIAWYGGNSGIEYDGGWSCLRWSEKQYREQKSCGTHAAGQRQANAWGLRDMLGNVWEWAWDWKGDYPTGSVPDPNGPALGSLRVVRGGGWDIRARGCRSAFRYAFDPGLRNISVGFRLVRTAPD